MKKNPLFNPPSSNPRVFIGVLLCFVGVALAFFAVHNTSAQGNPPSPEVTGQYRGLAPVARFDVSPALRDMQVIPPGTGKLRENEDRDIVPFKARFAPEWDPVVQSTLGGKEGPDGTEITGPIVTFNAQANVNDVSPPDPIGAVGPNHVVAMANLSFQIFNKTGTSLFGPANNNTLWAGFGGDCQTDNSGDPVVLYDKLANRWFLSQFTSSGPNFFFCVAISQTPDPTGPYFRYAISTGTNFPDYPKAGVWPDAYYISTREFAGATFAGVGAYALNRAQAVAGNPAAQVISFLTPPGATPYNLGDGLLPSDLDGALLPPAGRPNFYVGSMDNGGPYGAPQDALTLWKFTANFVTPASSTFVLANTIPVAAFNSILGLCGGTRACIPQPGTTNKLDHLGYRQRPLFRLAYRNFGDHESLVTNQSVSGGTGPNGEVSGIRWWELRSPNSSPVLFQQGTYAPGLTDGIHRWMGSIAMDREGNMALGYSAANGASPAVFPSVNYTGRLAGSSVGTMPLGEGSIVTGTGSQTGTNRWGDYTSLTIDPTDDLTFWYVNEWVPTTSAMGWRLRVGSFKVSQSAACNTYRVLIAYSETSISPSTLRSQILAEPGVAAVDLFDARVGTPTLFQLSSYDVVVAFSNTAYADPTAMGDVLADYADTGGVVVGFNFNWHTAPFDLAGRWMTGGYTPFNANAPILFTDSTLGPGTFSALHPLMQEVTALNGHFRHNVTLAPGATQVAAWADGEPLIAVKTQAGHTGVGINNYVGEAPNQWSGQFGRVIANAARWLKPAMTVSGAITNGDPTQTSRLFRGGVASECGAPNACSTIPGTYHYTAHTFVNTTGATACITTTLTTACSAAANQIFAGAYLNSFNPASICTNNIGDSGLSPTGSPVTFDYTVPAGATFIVVVSEVTADGGCPAYTLDIAGLCSPFVSISGTVLYCSNPVPGPVPNVTLTRTGTTSGSTLSNASGNYTFSSLPSGGSYTVTPSKSALTPGSLGITGVDAVATQRHFLILGTPLSGCRLTAADVTGNSVVDGVDAVAIQRFFLGFTTGVANTGNYKFVPVNRTYAAIVANQPAQNYDALVFGDVAPGFVERLDDPLLDAEGYGPTAGEVPAPVAAVALPAVAVDASATDFIVQVTTTTIDANNELVGFQGDFTFDERAVTFQSEPVQKAGLTGGNWNVSGNVLPGPGPIRTLRISAYSNDFTPLSGSGTLFELRMTRVSTEAQSTQLLWAAPPDQFIFIDADLKTQKPGYAASGGVNPSGKRK